MIRLREFGPAILVAALATLAIESGARLVAPDWTSLSQLLFTTVDAIECAARSLF